MEVHGNAEQSIRENVQGKWKSLKNWFVDTEKRECECKKVLKITNDVIRSIIQNAALIVQIQNWGISRKDDYKKFLGLFLKCENLEEAQKLSAHVFGVQKIEHFKTLEPRKRIPSIKVFMKSRRRISAEAAYQKLQRKEG